MSVTFQHLFEITNVVCFFFIIPFVFLGGYTFIISIFAWRKRNEVNNHKVPISTFALVVAAHNEENVVIRNIIENLKKLEYPGDMYDIYVVADNCTDRTSEIAKESGAFVYERFNDNGEGKGFALKWMFNILFSLDKKYDAVCVFDADNLVSINFLTEIDKKLSEGYKVVQGYRDVKNPFDSWVTVFYAITYWVSNRLFQLPRHYLRMNNILTGSGYAVRMSTLKEIGWEMLSLTEDIEFYIQIMLKGINIGWAHNAVIFDEQPLSLSQSWAQRKRWMQGHINCAVRYTKALSLKLLHDKSFAAFDGLIMILYPFILVFGSLIISLEIISCLALLDSIRNYIFTYLMSSAAAYLLQSIYFCIFIKLEKRYKPEVLIGLIILPVFNLTWIPIIIQGFINRNRKQWIHIAHIRSININELQS